MAKSPNTGPRFTSGCDSYWGVDPTYVVWVVHISFFGACFNSHMSPDNRPGPVVGWCTGMEPAWRIIPVVNNHMVIWLISPLKGWSPSKWPNFMASLHGVLLATYIHWDDPPSKQSFHLLQDSWNQIPRLIAISPLFAFVVCKKTTYQHKHTRIYQLLQSDLLIPQMEVT